MTRLALAVFGAVVVSSSAWAQAPAEGIDKALLAAPANLKNDATVVAFKPDYTYETVKKGANNLVCFDRSGLPGQQPFSVECTSLRNLDRVAQNLKFEAEPDKAKRQAALDAAEKDGSRVKPEFGSVWYRLQGKDQGDGAAAHHRGGTWCDGTVNGPTRQSEAGGHLDHERRDLHSASDDPGLLSTCESSRC